MRLGGNRRWVPLAKILRTYRIGKEREKIRVRLILNEQSNNLNSLSKIYTHVLRQELFLPIHLKSKQLNLQQSVTL